MNRVELARKKFTETEMEMIRIRGCQIVDDIKSYTSAVWTEQGLIELSYYDPELYRDVPGGACNFIAGALSTLHKVNGPCWVQQW